MRSTTERLAPFAVRGEKAEMMALRVIASSVDDDVPNCFRPGGRATRGLVLGVRPPLHPAAFAQPHLRLLSNPQPPLAFNCCAQSS